MKFEVIAEIWHVKKCIEGSFQIPQRFWKANGAPIKRNEVCGSRFRQQ